MKVKQKGFGLIIFILALGMIFGLTGCPPDPDPTCKCPDGTAHEPEDFPCCEADDCNCVITEPAVKEFKDQVVFMYVETPGVADIIDMRTACGSQNLDQLGIVEKIRDGIAAAYENATPPQKGNFRNVFLNNGKATITIENNVNYGSYEADNKTNVRFNIDYLLSVSDTDLQTILIAMAAEMNGLPMP